MQVPGFGGSYFLPRPKPQQRPSRPLCLLKVSVEASPPLPLSVFQDCPQRGNLGPSVKEAAPIPLAGPGDPQSSSLSARPRPGGFFGKVAAVPHPHPQPQAWSRSLEPTASAQSRAGPHPHPAAVCRAVRGEAAGVQTQTHSSVGFLGRQQFLGPGSSGDTFKDPNQSLPGVNPCQPACPRGGVGMHF